MSINHTSPKRRRWTLWVFLALAAFYLIAEHRAHLAGSLRWLPLGLLLLCPLMHKFMHGGHGDHGRDDDENKADRPPDGGHASMRDSASSKDSSDTSSGRH
ncbi:hypothetical protein CR155_16155 [Pollutimonas nitritireducens]|uniref:DUF2933 domain-containing protein n=3 Tax=Pollutimonas TaxID=2987599 RepID=A0A410GA51_9BURK|nr:MULTISPECIES: DUF2933 domain-containing protein [Pollutimonas]PLC48123.1 hypothetical protein CR159_19935 [Pollutimonas subterranea]PLC52932.1 hypothetical protein CR155_16155 [Pollutimonas nitritireducens]QAA93188.1 hypothetical protein CKA81_04550 [Pollutimonas thiosulfatoxidans]